MEGVHISEVGIRSSSSKRPGGRGPVRDPSETEGIGIIKGINPSVPRNRLKELFMAVHMISIHRGIRMGTRNNPIRCKGLTENRTRVGHRYFTLRRARRHQEKDFFEGIFGKEIMGNTPEKFKGKKTEQGRNIIKGGNNQMWAQS